MAEGEEKLSVEETKEKINKALGLSIKDGSWWSVMFGFGEYYLAPFAVFLQASSLQISFLASIPRLLAALLQLLAVKLTNVFESRRKIVLFFAIFQAFSWLAIVGISYLTKNVWLLIILASLYFIFGSMTEPAWVSWMGDLVPMEMRGRYFGKRNRIIGFVGFLSTVAAGLILDSVSSFDTFTAFAIIFTIACIGRLVSVLYLARQFEPIVEIREPKEFGFWKFLKRINNTNFGKFTLFSSFMLLSIFIAAPIFVIYILDVLKFSYFQYMVLIAAATITSFITIAYWGANADYYGNKTILWASSYLLALIPLGWYFVRFMDAPVNFIYCIILEIIGGFAWSGFNLASGNFLFDWVQPRNRIRLVAYSNALKGIGIFVGATIGGVIADMVMPGSIKVIAPTGILFVMLISTVARWFVATIYIPQLKDIKIVNKRPHFLHFVTVMPIQGMFFDSVVGMNRTLRRFKAKLEKIGKKLDYWEEDLKKKTKN